MIFSRNFARLSPCQTSLAQLSCRPVALAACALFASCAHAQVSASSHMPSSKRPATQGVPDGGPNRAQGDADGQSFRRHVPDPGAIAHLEAPVPHVTSLKNGLQVWLVSKRDLPLISAALVVKAGSAQDPQGAEGAASLLVDTMKLATETRDAHAIADEVEALGSSLDVGVADDAINFEVSALRDNLPPVLAVMADVVQRPKLAERDLQRAKDARLAELVGVADEPGTSVRQVFRRVVFADHPYGHASRGFTDTVKKLQQKQLAGYHAAHFRPGNAALILVGDLDEAQAHTLAEAAFGAWRGKPLADAPPKAATAKAGEVVLVDRPGAPQSQVMVGGLGAERSSADYYALNLCNAVLGGLFNSRINMNLREEKGWTYGARSGFTFLRSKGSFSVNAGIRTDVTAPAIHEIFAEIDRIRNELVGEDELRAAKNRYILSLPGSLQDVSSIGDMVASMVVHDLPPTYLNELPAKLEAVDVAEIRRVAQKYLLPEQMSVVVVGDKAKVEEGLLGLHRGALQLRDSEGQQLPGAAGKTPTP